MDVHFIAFTLLLLRLASITFIFLVSRRQWKLIKQDNPPEVQGTRIFMFALTVVVMLGNVIPIIIDSTSLLSPVSGQPPFLLTAYAYSNAIESATQSIIWFFFYKILEREMHAARDAALRSHKM